MRSVRSFVAAWGARAFGMFRATAVLRDAAGVELNRCDIAAIAWTVVQ